MHLHSLAISAAAMLAAALTLRPARADDIRISGPHLHENFAVYFVHGKSASGPVPLTLSEALDKGAVKVRETGEVNELKIENIGAEPVFIQSGEIVKGGRQDRTLTTSLVLPPHSGEIPIAAFCVEHGRWSGRGTEDAAVFASAPEAVPSREAKLAMRAPLVAAAPADQPPEDQVYERQKEVWDSVASTQSKLSGALAADVTSPASSTSLQLALENEKLQETRNAYVEALEAAGEDGGDIVGYAFAINGKLNSADVYSSNGLFRKMWSKQLRAAATEAIGEKGSDAAPPPSADDVKAFLDDAKRGAAKEQTLDASNTLETREGDKAIYFAAKPASGAWVHENYLAK